MKDPRIAEMCDPKSMPFDVKRMVYGGFKVLVDRLERLSGKGR
jgi:uncharacterized protein YbaA (DUF1428 family)